MVSSVRFMIFSVFVSFFLGCLLIVKISLTLAMRSTRTKSRLIFEGIRHERGWLNYLYISGDISRFCEIASRRSHKHLLCVIYLAMSRVEIWDGSVETSLNFKSVVLLLSKKKQKTSIRSRNTNEAKHCCWLNFSLCVKFKILKNYFH